MILGKLELAFWGLLSLCSICQGFIRKFCFFIHNHLSPEFSCIFLFYIGNWYYVSLINDLISCAFISSLWNKICNRHLICFLMPKWNMLSKMYGASWYALLCFCVYKIEVQNFHWNLFYLPDLILYFLRKKKVLRIV